MVVRECKDDSELRVRHCTHTTLETLVTRILDACSKIELVCTSQLTALTQHLSLCAPVQSHETFPNTDHIHFPRSRELGTARLSCEALPPFLSASRRGYGLGRRVGGGDGVAQVLVLLGEELDLVF